ncbi:MAG TPA: TolC family protein [Polyangiaceae bacterium]|jgi:outer membrane protein|nr:TolC family protein [Polyangiaceae bacterium]
MSRSHVARAAMPALGTWAVTAVLGGLFPSVALAQTAAPGTSAAAPGAPGPVPVAPATTAASGADSTRRIGVADAVGIALAHNPDALSSAVDLQSAEASRGNIGGQLGPKLHVDGALTAWNSAFYLSFGGENFEVRKRNTVSASFTLSQPITGLLPIYEEYKVAKLGVDVAAIQREAARRNVALAVIQAYYGLLARARLSAVADASVTQLEAQQKQAQSQFDNGVIGKNDLLRAGLALATAKQRAIETRGQIVIARSQLTQAMGVSPDEPLEVEPFSGSEPSSPERDLASAEAHALSQRVEVRALDLRIEQGEASVSAAKAKLAPQISAVANYTHFGGSAFQQADASYVGLVGSWDIWDWGTTWSGVTAADAQLSNARIARTKLEDQIRVEARQAFVNAQTSRDALGVARAAVTQGEENYRIVTKKFEANAATSFDMVDAESLLTQARAQVESALYDYLLARAALESATGAPLPGM